MSYQVGDALPERTFGPLSRTDIVRYQGASGDFNPIHHDESFAKSAGFPTVFSVGMLQASYLATYATDLLGPTAVRRFRTRFREQVWPDDLLTCTGTVTALRTDEDSGEKVADLELVVTRQTGGVAIQGWATFAL
ncbi:Acyl dehydratase [Parafrankia irregularis]|uniref:Acyl dehydratase n=1 Tax=Parafrankia irregularis TaxID=795642 RepID=A0A0S4QVT3_9ACTN|nr:MULTISPECIES: MaoC/PaaZ C-terminal domain-containing protein [Parafrankia]MBE3199951.1 MaoC family dehydratase N-terminal domain-containing protein [Parafrankia sp. CH37]CUU59305.1 Acyl dehydratase [Parafrankia irregularis]